VLIMFMLFIGVETVKSFMSQVKVIFLASTTNYHSFGETNFLYLHDWRWRRQYISPKCWCLLTSPQDATTQKTDIDIYEYTAVTTLNVEYLNRPIWHILDTSRNFISAACILLTLFFLLSQRNTSTWTCDNCHHCTWPQLCFVLLLVVLTF
jgi:hypothetical protein